MNELVFLQNNQALTTSLKVAETFWKRHTHVLDKIRALSAEISADVPIKGYAPKFIAQTYKDVEGREQPIYLLNRDAFTELVSNLNGKKAREWKRRYHAAFNAMEAALAERQSERWQELRDVTKTGYKTLSAAVHELYEWAVSHGCKAPEKVFYQNFARLMNKTLGITPNNRDTLALWQLFEIEKLQYIAQTIIRGLLAQGVDYHQPYQNCKLAFESYARLSFINQRLLETLNEHQP